MKFRYLRDPLFLAGCAGYALNRLLLKPRVASAFLRFWFNDLLLAACAIPLIIWIFRRVNLRSHDRPPSLLELAWIIALWSVLFEWAGPKFFSKGTGDWIDVLMYFSGAILAWCCWHCRQISGHEF